MTPTTTVRVEVEVPFQRVVDSIVGAIEGGSAYWCHTFQYLPASGDIVQDMRQRDTGIWYSEVEFWERGGGASLTFDKPNHDHSGKADIGMAQLRNGLDTMAAKAPQHFSDLITENDDATTHDVFLQMVLFGEIIFG